MSEGVRSTLLTICVNANCPAGQEAEQRGEYDERYPPEQPYSPGANPTGAGYPQPQDNYYPSTNAFPPPPNPGPYSPTPAYNPAEYPAQPAQAGQPSAQIHPDYGYPAGNPYAPPGPGGVYSPPPADPYAAPGAPRRADENVSAEPFLNTSSNIPTNNRYTPNNRYIPQNYRDHVPDEGG